jgi:hypothetical protein
MAFDYDLEGAKTALPPAIEAANEVIEKTSVETADKILEIAKKTGSDVLIKGTEACVQTIQASAKLLKDLVGEEGDSVTTATAQGLLASIKKLDQALNG